MNRGHVMSCIPLACVPEIPLFMSLPRVPCHPPPLQSGKKGQAAGADVRVSEEERARIGQLASEHAATYNRLAKRMGA